jgi:hypothetical protein
MSSNFDAFSFQLSESEPRSELKLSRRVDISGDLPKAGHVRSRGRGIPEDTGVAQLDVVREVVGGELELEILGLTDADDRRKFATRMYS